jgi:UDP-2-acetamido-3-amino-2,3-dideoxy-glucuronate N-acetyltransferase
LKFPEDEPLKLECIHFLECIKNGSAVRTDGPEGLRVLRVLRASQVSLDQNGRKIVLKQATPFSEKRVNRKNSLIHPTAIVDDEVTIGDGTKIWHFSHVLSGSTIGENCNIGQNVVVGPDVIIGKGCKIQNNVSVYKGVSLENGVFCGPSMVFTNVYNPRADIRKMDQVKSTLVKEGATLGANCTIVCGIVIGRYAFVGAGAVVNKNIPDHALVVGNPAKQIGWACVCGERLTNSLECLTCDKCFENTSNGLQAL